MICVLWLADMRTGSRSKGATKKETKEALKPVDDRKVGKRKAAPKVDKRQAKKDKKAKKDPNKPKRPPSAFFVFLEEFRKTFKKENPNVKAVSAVGKAGGEKWKSLTDAEKAPYEAKAAKKKAEYEKLMNAYNKKQESSGDEGDEGSEKSTSEVHDDEEESVQVWLTFDIILLNIVHEEVDEEEDDDDDDDDDDE
ncbi:UNVERIFIED_CONTAM: High mobility group B protein 3 [Sesamum calycinum]|uniref:High mobility group B protein 3 n=1 Tax=Sesamum calycinum TaxID=2727403 RepID=A0AAW2NYF7_9LAMI